ncbi:DUF262 domain-containing protein [Enterobacter chuandaensis]|uniref:DUF262 domain-containing protein n=1 Tax=Enterobacter chuandaensis TaxID=2497875 RepID=UPI00300C3B74
MKLEDVLNDIETLLIGKELQPINPSTGQLFVTKVDRSAGKYYVSSTVDGKVTSRSIASELGAIVDDLNRKGFCNVEQSLYGSGSSRNQPETIFANLPYIQHFKYKNKKHILLRKTHIHEAGTLSEVVGNDFRTLRRQVDNFFNLSLVQLNDKQQSLINDMYNVYEVILKKYPGELSVIKIDTTLAELKEINRELSGALVTLDKGFSQTELEKPVSDYISIEEALENPESTGVDSGDEDSDSTADIEPKTDKPSEVIKVRPLTPTLSLIFDRIQFDDMELQPDFQRKDRIWKEDKKSKLIESILMRLPLPIFYFGEKKGGKWIVVDGLQRVTSIYDFMSGVFPLMGLEVLPELNGKYFKDLSRTEQRDIREYAITAYLIDVNDGNADIIVELFHRINTYGVKLSDQEIRSALNQGTSVKFLRFLASLDSFKIATREKVKPDRQKDMELCLSALSFIVLGYKSYGQNSYDTFLSKAMAHLNRYNLQIDNEEYLDSGGATINVNSKYYHELYQSYNSALLLAKEVFGEFAFVKDPLAKNAPISKQLFELVIYYFSSFDESQKNTVRNNAQNLIDCLYKAINDNSKDYAQWDSQTYILANRGFKDSLSTSTGKKTTVMYRFSAFENILKESTGIII